jgi:hypothetical protein
VSGRGIGGRLRAAWTAWVELWDRREPATALALVRMLVAAVVLADFYTVWRLDLIEALWAPPPAGIVEVHNLPWLVERLGPSTELAWWLWLAEVVALVGMITGTLTRVSCLLFVVVSAQLAQMAPDADRGIDTVLRMVVAILALSQSHARWSVDAWLWRRLGRPFGALVPAWPRLLLLLQLIWVYFSSGHNKAPYEWGFAGHFSALGNTLSDPHFARWNPAWFEPIYPMTQVATAATMAFELSAPLMLLWLHYAATADRPGRLRRWSNRARLRWLWLGLGVSFHLGIAIFMQLGIFAWGMLALYPVLFLPDELAAAEAWLRGAVGERRRSAPADHRGER